MKPAPFGTKADLEKEFRYKGVTVTRQDYESDRTSVV